MKKFNFHNKAFSLINNSKNGESSNQTLFKYQQNDDLVTADYYGGNIRYGKIIAQLKGTQLLMLYQCLTTNNELKAGKATANISINNEGKILLHLNWEWLEKNEKGTSIYIEN